MIHSFRAIQRSAAASRILAEQKTEHIKRSCAILWGRPFVPFGETIIRLQMNTKRRIV